MCRGPPRVSTPLGALRRIATCCRFRRLRMHWQISVTRRFGFISEIRWIALLRASTTIWGKPRVKVNWEQAGGRTMLPKRSASRSICQTSTPSPVPNCHSLSGGCAHGPTTPRSILKTSSSVSSMNWTTPKACLTGFCITTGRHARR